MLDADECNMEDARLAVAELLETEDARASVGEILETDLRSGVRSLPAGMSTVVTRLEMHGTRSATVVALTLETNGVLSPAAQIAELARVRFAVPGTLATVPLDLGGGRSPAAEMLESRQRPSVIPATRETEDARSPTVVAVLPESEGDSSPAAVTVAVMLDTDGAWLAAAVILGSTDARRRLRVSQTPKKEDEPSRGVVQCRPA